MGAPSHTPADTHRRILSTLGFVSTDKCSDEHIDIFVEEPAKSHTDRHAQSDAHAHTHVPALTKHAHQHAYTHKYCSMLDERTFRARATFLAVLCPG